MSTPSTEELLKRIEYLEEQNYGIKRVGIVSLILLLVIGAGLVYQMWAELGAVVTQGVVMSDSNSQPNAAFTVTGRGHVGMLAYQNGALPPIQDASVSEPFRGLGFYDSKGNLRIQVGISPDDQPTLVAWAPDGKTKLWEAVPRQAAQPPAPPQPTDTPNGGGTPPPSPKPSAIPTKEAKKNR